MPTLPNIGLITPALGGDSGVWDDRINACFALLDAHDHTSGKGLPIPVSALNIDDDLPMAGAGLVNLGKISFTTITAPTTGSKNLFVNTADNELYWRTNSGTNVKLTSGASINATLIGGIVGDYASAGAALAYDDTNSRYTFKTPTATWARMASGPVRLLEYNTTESVYVELVAPAGLAGSYTVTWPAALNADPVATLQISSSGVMTTVSTTERCKTVSAFSYRELGGTAHTLGSTLPIWALGNSINILACPLHFAAGDVITEAVLHVTKNSDATNTLSFSFIEENSDGTQNSIATAMLSTNAPGTTTIPLLGLNVTVVAGKTYSLRIQQNDNTPSGIDAIMGAEIYYTALV